MPQEALKHAAAPSTCLRAQKWEHNIVKTRNCWKLPSSSLQFSPTFPKQIGAPMLKAKSPDFPPAAEITGDKTPLNHHSKSLPIPDCAVETPTIA